MYITVMGVKNMKIVYQSAISQNYYKMKILRKRMEEEFPDINFSIADYRF